MQKVLIVATVYSHIAQFHKPLINLLKENNIEVHVAGKDNLSSKNGLSLDEPDKKYELSFSRNPFSLSNIKAFYNLKSIISDYDVVHCNTPIAGFYTRLAAKKYRKSGLKVIYTAHGFHFYKGGSIIGWLVYYPLEKMLSKITDTIITINSEDFEIAKKKFSCSVKNINGVGISTSRFNCEKEANHDILSSLNIKSDQFIILAVGELNKNKNQITIIKAMSELLKNDKNYILIIAGNGKKKSFLEKKIKKMGLIDSVFLVGYRTDISDFYNLASLLVSMSFREGLPMNILEAMSSGVPVVASTNRGHRELVSNNVNGLLVDPKDHYELAKKITILKNNDSLRRSFARESFNVLENFTLENVLKALKEIYTL